MLPVCVGSSLGRRVCRQLPRRGVEQGDLHHDHRTSFVENQAMKGRVMMTSRRAPLVLARGLTAAPIHVPDHLKQLDYLTLAMPTGRCMIVGRPLFKYPIAVVPPPEEVAPLLSAIRNCECRPFRIISFADEMGKVSTRCLPRLTQWRAAPVIAAPSHPTRLVPHCPPAAPPHSTTTNSILMCCHRSSTAPSSAARRMCTPGSTGSLITHSPVAARRTSAVASPSAQHGESHSTWRRPALSPTC